MHRNFIIALAGIITGFGFVQIVGESPQRTEPRLPIPIRVIEVKDGDTIAADVLLPWDVTLRAQDIRELSFDAWESSRRRRSEAAGEITDAEIGKGKLATSALKFLLESGEAYAEPQRNAKAFGERDVYGRVLAKLWVKRESGWLDVGAEMKRRGHVRKPP